MILQSVQNSHAERRNHMRRIRKLARSKDPQRSKVANGSVLVAGVDGRSVWVRRAREIIADAVSDLGGEANISSAERSLIRRAATLSVELERLEQRFALAEQTDNADLDTYQKLTNTLRRLLATIGLSRRAKTVVPSLSDYLSNKREAAE